MSLSQMEVFNKYIMPATIETLDTEIEKFNAASGGSIIMTSAGFEGDFMRESFFAAVHGAQRRVDRYGANTDAAPTDLTQIKESSVKVAGGFGPIRYEPSQMTWLNKPTAEGIEAASRNFAEALLKDQLHTAIASAVAAISNQAGLVNNASGGMSYNAVNGAHAKFGDQSGNLISDIMTGAVMHSLIGANLANAERLFSSNGVTVVNMLGKLVVVTDAPALYEAGTPNKDKVLSLTSSGVIVTDGGDAITNVETKNGKERIETTVQMDYTFGVGLKGFSWNETAGGKSPSDAALATGTNWVKSATSRKHCAGVIAIADAS